MNHDVRFRWDDGLVGPARHIAELNHTPMRVLAGMSLHKSKGLTADLVAVVGCIEGLVPTLTGSTPAEQSASLEEQRRLFYVAITRTRRVLILSSVTQLRRNLAYRIGAQVRGWNAIHATTIASRFLAELGPSRPAAVLGTAVLEGEPA